MSAKKPVRKRRPATTPEGRENQLISSAFALAERQLMDGSAAATVIVHFLKLASTREALEQAKIQHENLLLSAKIEALASGKRLEELFEKAISAMRQYTGRGDSTYDD